MKRKQNAFPPPLPSDVEEKYEKTVVLRFFSFFRQKWLQCKARSAKCIIIFFKDLEASWLSSYTPYSYFIYFIQRGKHTNFFFHHVISCVSDSFLSFFLWAWLLDRHSLSLWKTMENEKWQGMMCNQCCSSSTLNKKVRDCVHNVLNKNALQSSFVVSECGASIFLFNVL